MKSFRRTRGRLWIVVTTILSALFLAPHDAAALTLGCNPVRDSVTFAQATPAGFIYRPFLDEREL